MMAKHRSLNPFDGRSEFAPGFSISEVNAASPHQLRKGDVEALKAFLALFAKDCGLYLQNEFAPCD